MIRSSASFFVFVLILFTLTTIPVYGAQDDSRQITLDNGLRVYLYERHNLPLLHVVCAFDFGSKNETDDTSGLAHLLEHTILFRGTAQRTGNQISREIRRHGAYFNAHTGRDVSLFELSCPSRFADFAFRNQKDVLFDLQIKQEELDKEKDVILEEISQLNDDPERYALFRFFSRLFPGHPYGRPIYGSMDVIAALSAETVETWYKRYFVPNRCALAVVGDLSLTAMEEKVRTVFSGIPRGEDTIPEIPMAPVLPNNDEFEVRMDIQKTYMVIGKRGPDYNHPDRYGVDVLTQVLGRGVNPLLSTPLRGRRRLVDALSMGYSALRYGGAIHVTLILDSKNINSAKRETVKFLKSAQFLNYTRDDFIGDDAFYALDYLESAKNQLRFGFHRAQENGLQIASSLARYMLLNTQTERGGYLNAIDAVDSGKIRKIASDYLGKGRYVTVIMRPQTKGK
ncbi:MAG: insulinase family protein [Candidatus Aminicenantes bacterium]|nr:insulinase family protein [Candidatus Aminicenantes bacterium]